MKSTWKFYHPTEISFSPRIASQIGRELSRISLASRGKVGIITGKTAAARYGYTEMVEKSLEGREVCLFKEVEAEPSRETVRRGIEWAEREEITSLVALGGGSVIDAAKAISCLVGREIDIGQVMDREVEIPPRKLALVAIPMTAGTGSEVTPFSVITNDENGLKESVASDHYYPDLALVDPELLATVPQTVRGDVGMDALSHAFEALWSVHDNPISDGLAYQAISHLSRHLIDYYHNPENERAAAGVAQGSLLAGRAFSQTFTAAVHALSFPIGRRFDLTHGASCAMTLHLVAEYNMPAVEEKFAQVARILELESHREVPGWIKGTRYEVQKVHSLKDLGGSREDMGWIAENAFAPLLENNPLELKGEKIMELLSPLF